MDTTQYYIYDSAANLVCLISNKDTTTMRQYQPIRAIKGYIQAQAYDISGNQQGSDDSNGWRYHCNGSLAQVNWQADGYQYQEYYTYAQLGVRVRKVTEVRNLRTGMMIALVVTNYVGKVEFRATYQGVNLNYDGDIVIDENGVEVAPSSEHTVTRIKSGHGQIGKLDKNELTGQQRLSYNALNRIDNNELVLDKEGNLRHYRNYSSYGETIEEVQVEGNTSELGYSGQEQDDSGLIYYGHRYLQTQSGVWNRADPIRFASGQLNLYNLVNGNPITWRDKEGLITYDFHKTDLLLSGYLRQFQVSPYSSENNPFNHEVFGETYVKNALIYYLLDERAQFWTPDFKEYDIRALTRAFRTLKADDTHMSLSDKVIERLIVQLTIEAPIDYVIPTETKQQHACLKRIVHATFLQKYIDTHKFMSIFKSVATHGILNEEDRKLLLNKENTAATSTDSTTGSTNISVSRIALSNQDPTWDNKLAETAKKVEGVSQSILAEVYGDVLFEGTMKRLNERLINPREEEFLRQYWSNKHTLLGMLNIKSVEELFSESGRSGFVNYTRVNFGLEELKGHNLQKIVDSPRGQSELKKRFLSGIHVTASGQSEPYREDGWHGSEYTLSQSITTDNFKTIFIPRCMESALERDVDLVRTLKSKHIGVGGYDLKQAPTTITIHTTGGASFDLNTKYRMRLAPRIKSRYLRDTPSLKQKNKVLRRKEDPSMHDLMIHTVRGF